MCMDVDDSMNINQKQDYILHVNVQRYRNTGIHYIVPMFYRLHAVSVSTSFKSIRWTSLLRPSIRAAVSVVLWLSPTFIGSKL